MRRFNQYMPERQIEQFRALAQQTEIPVSELMRRMFDHCFREEVLNTIVPALSGRLEVQFQR